MSNESIKKKLIEEVQALAEKLGRTPFLSEFENGQKACYRFGTWNNFLKEAGLKINITYNDYSNISDDELLDMIKKEIARIGSTTFESFYRNKSKGIPSFSYIQKRFGFKWNELLEKLGLEINLRDMTNDELLRQLKDVSEEIGRSPSINELSDRGISVSVYISRFGSYNKALEVAGLDVNFERSKVTHTEEELIEMYVNLCNRLGKTATSKDIDKYLEYNSDVFVMRFGSMNTLRELAGYEQINMSKKYTKENIKIMLIKEYRKNNRRLNNKELTQLSKENKDFPGISTICRHFKTTKTSEVWEQIEESEKDRIYETKILMEEIKELANVLGRTPAAVDFDLSGKAINLFGSWNNFIMQAGLKVNKTVSSYRDFTKDEIIQIVTSELKRIGSQTKTDYMRYKYPESPSAYYALKTLEADSWYDVLKMIGVESSKKNLRLKIKRVEKCNVSYCDRSAKIIGYCNKHYQQIRANGYLKDEKTDEEKIKHIERVRGKRVKLNNKTGVKGVLLRESGKYEVSITDKGKQYYLGRFDTLEEAIQARIEGEKKYWGKVYSKQIEKDH